MVGAVKHPMVRSAFPLLLSSVLLANIMAQSPQSPNVEVQRAALKKLSFLIGKWAGSASAARGSGLVVELVQTGVAQFKRSSWTEWCS